MFLLGLGFPGRSAAIEWEEPERISVNGFEEQTNGGSLAVTCAGGVYAVWQVGYPGYPVGDIFFAERTVQGWSTPVAIDPGHLCDKPHVAAAETGEVHLVWQRDSGNPAEIMYAFRPVGGEWEIEPLTSNATKDLSPAIDLDPFGRPHVVWEGFYAPKGTGKIFYATRDDTWQVEALLGSELGTAIGVAFPRISVDTMGDAHVVHIQADHIPYQVVRSYYARSSPDGWVYQVLDSPTLIDLTVDVDAVDSLVHVAMSGENYFGSPLHIYHRRSTDGGKSFGAPELVSGDFSSLLSDLDADSSGRVLAVGGETSANFYTENIVIAERTEQGWTAELLPPADEASSHLPSMTIADCGQGEPAGSVLYANRRLHLAPNDSMEIYYRRSLSGPTPVTLTLFEATSEDGAVHLRWRTSFESDNLGFDILRSEETAPEEPVAIHREPAANGDQPGEYAYVDRMVGAGRTYLYFLEAITADGPERHGPVRVTVVGAAPRQTAFAPNWPNPFDRTTTVTFELHQPGHVSLVIYDLGGRAVRTLVAGHRGAAVHSLAWDGRDEDGHSLPAGVYLAKLRAGDTRSTRKILITR